MTRITHKLKPKQKVNKKNSNTLTKVYFKNTKAKHNKKN